MEVALHPMMIKITMMVTPRITMKIIITQKMRNMIMIIFDDSSIEGSDDESNIVSNYKK